ncbi:uncharacterized protein LOC144920338 [Branchiostoma floridae x Branchiostoma belcheri]
MDGSAEVAILMLSEVSLTRLASELGNEWRSLGIFLGVPKAKVDQCFINHPGDVRAAIVDMLVMWQQETSDKGPKAQVADLVQALKEIGRVDLAERVEVGNLIGHPDQGAGNGEFPYQGAGNRAEARGDRNVINIQTGDHANITVSAPFTGRGAADEGYGAAASATPTPGYTSLPVSRTHQPRPIPQDFSQDGVQHSQEYILENCIRQLQEMGFTDEGTKQEVQNLISTGLAPQYIVQTIVDGKAQEHEELNQQQSFPNNIQPVAREAPPSDGQDSSSSEESEDSARNPGDSSSTFDSPDGTTTGEVHQEPTTSPLQNPTGGSPDASLSDESLHLQGGGNMQDNLASNQPETPDVGPRDVSTSDEERLLEVPPEETNETAMGAPAASHQLHPAETREQVEEVADGAGDQPVYDTERRLYIFTTAHIEEMTENFSQSKQIHVEVGAFGPIYFLEKFSYDVHGPSQDQPLKDLPLAIKVNRSEDQGPREFKQELVMAGYRHPHILPLIGICEDEGCLALIYAYMDNKDLLTHMKDQAQRPLNYKQRLLISLDLISAVLYYHRTERFHRDIKSANVLLDGNYRARLGDPGLMIELPSDKSHLSHTVRSVARCGTTYYQCPYYAVNGKFYESSDTFSAGKVLLELLTGKPADAVDEEGIVLFNNWCDELEYFRDNTGKGLCNVADVCWPEVGEDGNSVTQRFAKLIVGCLQPHPRRRIKLEVLYQELKDLAKTAGVLGTSSAVMPTMCTYCLACKPCPIPMACGCDYLICIACMKEHGKALYCPNHHADTTGLGQNTFAVIVGQRGFEKDAEDFRDAITNPNICAIRKENVAVLIKATIREVQKEVEKMGAKIKSIPAGQQTTFIYYHSGHGIKDWIPEDGKEDLIPVSGLAFKDNAVTWSQRLKTILEKSKAHQSLFILDACFASSMRIIKLKGSDSSNSPGEADHEQSSDESTGRQNMYDNILRVPESCILWASSRGNEESASENGQSLFTKYVVKGLQGGNCGEDSCSYCQSFQQLTKNMGAVSLEILQKYVREHLTRDLPQNPSLQGQVELYWIAYTKEQ